MPVYFPTSQFT